jgi:hypothetical protein
VVAFLIRENGLMSYDKTNTEGKPGNPDKKGIKEGNGREKKKNTFAFPSFSLRGHQPQAKHSQKTTVAQQAASKRSFLVKSCFSRDPRGTGERGRN